MYIDLLQLRLYEYGQKQENENEMRKRMRWKKKKNSIRKHQFVLHFMFACVWANVYAVRDKHGYGFVYLYLYFVCNVQKAGGNLWLANIPQSRSMMWKQSYFFFLSSLYSHSLSFCLFHILWHILFMVYANINIVFELELYAGWNFKINFI